MIGRADLLRGVALASFAGLCLTILGVAAVAVVAETYATWRWYFRMEQAMAVGTPLAVGLFALTAASAFGLVYAASDEAE